MGNTRSCYFWHYAICATGCTDNMYGISRLNGIFYPGRRNDYQTSSIPPRLAPMSFYYLFFERKKKENYAFAIWINRNNIK